MEIRLSEYIKEYNVNSINDCLVYLSQFAERKLIIDGNKTYQCGNIKLISNLTLIIEKGATIQLIDHDNFDLNISRKTDLDVPSFENCDYNGQPSKYFIHGFNLNNITIDGEGIIDGNEKLFYGNITKWHIEGSYYPRIPLLYFENCKNLTIKNITLTKSAFWTTHLVGCEDVLIDGLKIYNNLRMTNCDGIDPDCCRNITIKNCYIESADDCIVFKSTDYAKKYGITQNIRVMDCTLKSTSAAIKFGTESNANIKDIDIKNIKILSSNRGISLQLRDSGSFLNISFENIFIETRRFKDIYWWGKAEGISLTAVRRNENTKVGNISNISFKNINIDGEKGIFIYGENKNISNISFDNVFINLNKKTDYSLDVIDLRPSELGIIEHPLNVIYVNNAKSISFNVKYKIDERLNIKDIYYLNETEEIL